MRSRIKGFGVVLPLFLTLSLSAIAGTKEGVAAYKMEQFANAAKELLAPAKRGDADAEFYLGLMYESGKGVDRSLATATEWYQKAVDHGNPAAMVQIGFMYFNGRGVTKDEVKAFDLFRKAAKKNFPRAFNEVGFVYSNGKAGVTRDDAEALSWYKKGAELGDPTSIANVGVFAESGRAGAKDLTVALSNYRKAAELGNAFGMVRLGLLFENGTGVDKDTKQASDWYRKSAELGNALAQTNLGKLHVNGAGVEKNPVHSSLAIAQTDYEKIEVGNLLTTGIGLGTFVKPIPLPAGEWLVVSKHVEDVELTSSSSSVSRPTPRIFLTLKNNHPADAVLFAIVLTFTPESSNVNWGNRECANANPKVLIDNFGYNASSMVYVCSSAYSHTGFKAKVAKINEGTNKWWKSNLTDMIPYSNEIPDNLMWVDVVGNQFKGKSVNIAFLLKRDGDASTDPAYAKHVKDWVHATGLSLAKVLDNSATDFVLPTAYVAQK